MPEDGDAGAGPEKVERLTHRDVEGAAAARDADEERIDEARQLVAGGFVPLARERPVEDGSGARKRGEMRLDGIGEMESGFRHRNDGSAPLRHWRRHDWGAPGTSPCNLSDFFGEVGSVPRASLPRRLRSPGQRRAAGAE